MKCWKVIACLIVTAFIATPAFAKLTTTGNTRMIPVFNSEIDVPAQCEGQRIYENDWIEMKEVKSPSNDGKAVFEIEVWGYNAYTTPQTQGGLDGNENMIIATWNEEKRKKVLRCGPFYMGVKDEYGQFRYEDVDDSGILSWTTGKYFYGQSDPGDTLNVSDTMDKFAAHTSVFSLEKERGLFGHKMGCAVVRDSRCAAMLHEEKRPHPVNKGEAIITAVLEVEDPYNVENVMANNLKNVKYNSKRAYGAEANFEVAYDASNDSYKVGVGFEWITENWEGNVYHDVLMLGTQELNSHYWEPKLEDGGSFAFMKYPYEESGKPSRGEVIYKYPGTDIQAVCAIVGEDEVKDLSKGKSAEAISYLGNGCKLNSDVSVEGEDSTLNFALEVKGLDSDIAKQWLL